MQYEQQLERLPQKQLHSVANFLIGPFGSAYDTSKYVKNGIHRYIRGQDVKPFILKDDDPRFVSSEDFDDLKKYALQEGDVLVSVVGTLGNVCIVQKKDTPAIFSCKSTVIRARQVDPVFLTTYLNSKYGKALLLRKERGAIQKGLNLDDLREIQVPDLSDELKKLITKSFWSAQENLITAKANHTQAGAVLLDALGLSDWQPPNPTSYERSSKDVFSRGRLDAEYFSPSVSHLLEILYRDGLRIHDLASVRRTKFSPDTDGTFNYIEIGGVLQDGTAETNEIEMQLAPSRASQHVKTGDIITSTVRPIRRLSAIVSKQQNNAVCSSGFVVLEPHKISSATLLTYLRLPMVCELMDLHTSASLYPAIAEQDIVNLPIPNIPQIIQAQIDQAITETRENKIRAGELLEAAKRAVEIAIEDSEAAALTYLQSKMNDEQQESNHAG